MLFLLVCSLLCQITTAQINTVTEETPAEESCSFEEIIERKRQAVKIQLLAKLNIRSLPNNTRNDIPEDVRRQIAAIYQIQNYRVIHQIASSQPNELMEFCKEMINEDRGRQRDDPRSRPPKTKQNLLFPEAVKELGSNTLLYTWSVQTGGVMADRAEIHLPPELTVPSLRVYIVNNPSVYSETKLRREGLERLFGDRIIDVTKHWRRWTLDASSNHGILFCVGRCFSENNTLEMFGSKPYITVEIAAVDNKRHKRYGGSRSNTSPQTCTSFPRQCCKKDHWITFKEVGLDHIILEPQAYNAGLCLGVCNEMWLEQFYHSHVMSLSENVKARNCCSPVSVDSLRIIYYDKENDTHKFEILPNMEVTECGCK